MPGLIEQKIAIDRRRKERIINTVLYNSTTLVQDGDYHISEDYERLLRLLLVNTELTKMLCLKYDTLIAQGRDEQNDPLLKGIRNCCQVLVNKVEESSLFIRIYHFSNNYTLQSDRTWNEWDDEQLSNYLTQINVDKQTIMAYDDIVLQNLSSINAKMHQWNNPEGIRLCNKINDHCIENASSPILNESTDVYFLHFKAVCEIKAHNELSKIMNEDISIATSDTDTFIGHSPFISPSSLEPCLIAIGEKAAAPDPFKKQRYQASLTTTYDMASQTKARIEAKRTAELARRKEEEKEKTMVRSFLFSHKS